MDQNSAHHGIRVEREETPQRAIIVGLGLVQNQVAQQLVRQGMEISWCQTISEVVSLPEAKFVFLFLDSSKIATEGDVFILKITTFAKQFSAKLSVIFNQLDPNSETQVEELVKSGGGNPTIVEVRSGIHSETVAMEVAGKIVRLALSTRAGDKLIIGEFGGNTKEHEEAGRIVSQKPIKVATARKKISLKPLVWPVALFTVFILPVIFGAIYTVSAVGELWQAKQALTLGKIAEAKAQAQIAEEKFGVLNDVCGNVAVVSQIDKACNGFLSGKLAADTIFKAAIVQEKMKVVAAAFFSVDGESPDISEFSELLSNQSGGIEENLGFLEANFSKDLGFIKTIAGLVGASQKKMEQYLSQIPKLRTLARAGREIGPVTPEVLGMSDFFSQTNTRKTYLIVFQNSLELRATGGFIGSYAIMHVDKGRMLDVKVSDMYESDAQLKGRIVPPDEILEYLGQPAWFMRDANFSPDFPLSAKRLSWFLEKETGQSVDGVIAVNLSALKELLKVTGPVKIQSSSELISANNFLEKAEFAAELNFAAESGQKRDFMGEVSEAMLERVSLEQGIDFGKLVQVAGEMFSQKEMLAYFTSGPAQKAMEDNGFSGSIAPRSCFNGQNCLMVVEDNFGANKVNYFVKKAMKVESIVDKAGGVTTNVTLSFNNTSPNDSFPGGRYKNYLRIVVPKAAELREFNIGDNRTASVSAVLSAEVVGSVPANKFLVYQTDEEFLTTRETEATGFKSFGALVEIPAGTKKEVRISYHVRNQLDMAKETNRLELTILKQPGSEFKPVTVQLGYPTFLKPEIEQKLASELPIVKPQELDYNTILDRDLTFGVKLNQN